MKDMTQIILSFLNGIPPGDVPHACSVRGEGVAICLHTIQVQARMFVLVIEDLKTMMLKTLMKLRRMTMVRPCALPGRPLIGSQDAVTGNQA